VSAEASSILRQVLELSVKKSGREYSLKLGVIIYSDDTYSHEGEQLLQDSR